MGPLLSPIEAILWRAGQDPTLRMTVGNLVILERRPDQGELVARVSAAVDRAPRLRWRPDDPSRGHLRPGWVDLPELVPENHVRVLSVPAPGGDRQVLDLLSLVDASHFESVRPPWDVTVIDGLEGGRAALYMRADHVLTDGVGGNELVKLLLDEPPAPEPPKRAAARRSPPADPEPSDPTPGLASVETRRPGTVTVTVDFTTLARPVTSVLSRVGEIDPVDTLVRTAQRGADIVSSIAHQLVVPGGALSPLEPSGSMSTRFELLSVPGARRAALRLGGSRTALLVAAVAAGLGDYHERQGVPVASLRMASPVLLRRARPFGSNSFAPMRVEIPASAGHAGPQFGAVADRLARARHEPATHLSGPVLAAINLLPGRALVPAVRAQIGTVDFIATALSGPRRFGAICGAAIQGSYPFGPRAGRLVNITALGNGDGLDLGIALDPVAVRSPEMLVECLEEAFARLIDQPGESD